MRLRPREPIDNERMISLHMADADWHLQKWLFRMRR